MINFDSIKISNFLSFGDGEDAFEFDFNCHNGMQFLTGSNYDSKSGLVKNGCGKSSIIDAILYALYGKSSKNVSKENLNNRVTGKPFLIELLFTIGSDHFHIKTGSKPTSCILLKNGSDISKPSCKETWDYICKEIIKSPYIIFKNSVVLSVTDNESLFVLTKSQKREFIERLFEVGIYGKMCNLVKDDLVSANRELMDKCQQHKLNKDSITQVENIYKDFKKNQEEKIRKFELEIEKLEKDKHALETNESSTDYEALIIEVNSKIDEQRKKIKQLNQIISKVEFEIKSLQKEFHSTFSLCLSV
jgi:DNA repair exonuclease SbcCD ATPase subunit